MFCSLACLLGKVGPTGPRWLAAVDSMSSVVQLCNNIAANDMSEHCYCEVDFADEWVGCLSLDHLECLNFQCCQGTSVKHYELLVGFIMLSAPADEFVACSNTKTAARTH